MKRSGASPAKNTKTKLRNCCSLSKLALHNLLALRCVSRRHDSGVKRNARNPTAVFLKADFTNAFNTVDRATFLEHCKQNLPGLFPWAAWCYAEPSNLLCGGRTIPSEYGVQQGEPLGPLLFALALQPVLERLAAARTPGGLQLVFSYLDDTCLEGDQRAVATAFADLKAASASIGLELNMSKCELIPAAGLHSNIDRSLFPSDVTFNPKGEFELLGGPIGSQDFCNDHTQDRVTKATKLLSALGELPNPQLALLLLRHCASFGKLVFSTRVVPHRAHSAALRSFDIAVHECFESFMCCGVSDEEWTLATLSTKLSGLGLRSTEKHSSAAFLASRSACHSLCTKLDPDHVWEISDRDSAAAHALSDYNSNVAEDDRLPTQLDDPPRQRQLSHALDARTRARLQETSDTSRRAHMELTSVENAGQWLHTTPSSATQSKVDPLLFKTSIQRWLRTPIFENEFTCSFCDGVMDVWGDHCLVCPGGGDRTKRHNLIRNAAFHFCAIAGFNAELETPGLLRPRPSDGALPEDGVRRDNPEARRPADVYIPRWRRGTPMALDFAVSSGLRSPATVAASLQNGGATTRDYERFQKFIS